jgi:hypothetical protein
MNYNSYLFYLLLASGSSITLAQRPRVRGRRPHRPLQRRRKLVSLEESASRETRADQGVPARSFYAGRGTYFFRVRTYATTLSTSAPATVLTGFILPLPAVTIVFMSASL